MSEWDQMTEDERGGAVVVAVAVIGLLAAFVGLAVGLLLGWQLL